MKRLLVLLVLAAVSLSATAATTIKSSKSNSSDREQAPATAVAEDEPATAADKATAGNGAKADRYRGVLTQQGRVQAAPFGGNQPNAAPGPAESSNLNSGRTNTFRTQGGQPGATPSPGPVESIQLNSSRASTYRTQTGQPGVAERTAKTQGKQGSVELRVRGTPESSPPKPAAAGTPSAEPDKPAQDQKPFHF